MNRTPGRWVVVRPGGPNGPYWSVLTEDGMVVAPLVATEADAHFIAAAANPPSVEEMRALLVRADSYLSLLRHRCERDIPWGTLGIVTLQEMDALIDALRRASGGK